MSRFLNNEMRDEIVSAVMAATFFGREKELKDWQIGFADRVYLALIPEQFAANVKNLPENYFFRSKTIEIRHDEKRESGSVYVCSLKNISYLLTEQDRFSRNKHDIDMSVSKPFPNFLVSGHQACLWFDASSSSEALLSEYLLQEKAAVALVSERSERSEALSRFLSSIKTVQRLIEVAPELKTYVPAYAFFDRAPVPAPIVGTLITDLMKSGLQLSTVGV